VSFADGAASEGLACCAGTCSRQREGHGVVVAVESWDLRRPLLGALRRLWTVSFMLQPQALWTALPIWTRG